MQRKGIKVLILVICIIITSKQVCVHSHFTQNATFHYYDDLKSQPNHQFTKPRLLQTQVNGTKVTLTNNRITSNNLRIFMDYSLVKVGNSTEINLIKRVCDLAARYYYYILSVNRVGTLFYPANTSLQCSGIQFPQAYVTKGITGDIGIMISNQNSQKQYISKSTSCILLKSTNRPIWGVMVWNNRFLQYDQVGFQKIIYVAIHQIMHVLGYSASLYQYYGNGNPHRVGNKIQYLTSPIIQVEVQKYFNCSKPLGIILEDQDGTAVPSHHQRKIFGNELMIPSAKIGTYYSRMSMAVLASTGWYMMVSYNFTEPSIWGRGKGCNFLDVDNCKYEQFCTGSGYNCNFDKNAMGVCEIDVFAGACKMVNNYVNTICIDQNFEVKNLNGRLMTKEKGGYNSRCFGSNIRAKGTNGTLLNNRCYVTVCSDNGNYLYVMVGNAVLSCNTSKPGAVVSAPGGMEGVLRCPMSFGNYCGIKKTCTYNCNKNGICINGLCLCTGATSLTPSCLDITYTISQQGGGKTKVLTDSRGQLLGLKNSSNRLDSTNSQKSLNKLMTNSLADPTLKTLSRRVLSNRCFDGTYFDPIFGECLKCSQAFNCNSCTIFGCVRCSGKYRKYRGKCQAERRKL